MIIYRIQNIITGEFYIGQTITDLRGRLSRHDCDCNRNDYTSRLHNSMRKYGKEFFIIGEIEKCNTPSELNEREIYWIDKLKPPLNIQRGGNSVGKHSSESIRLMSDKTKDRWRSYSDERRKQIVDTYKKAKQTERYRNLPIWNEMVRKKGSPIFIEEVDGNEEYFYYSMRECERDGWNRSTIQRHINRGSVFLRRDNGKRYKVRKKTNVNVG